MWWHSLSLDLEKCLPCARTRGIGVSSFRSNLLSSAAWRPWVARRAAPTGMRERERERSGRTFTHIVAALTSVRLCVSVSAAGQRRKQNVPLSEGARRVQRPAPLWRSFRISWRRGTRRRSLIARAFVRFTSFARLAFSTKTLTFLKTRARVSRIVKML